RDAYAHSLQKIREALCRKQGLLAIAGSIEANDETITYKFVVAHAFNRDEIFQANAGLEGLATRGSRLNRSGWDRLLTGGDNRSTQQKRQEEKGSHTDQNGKSPSRIR